LIVDVHCHVSDIWYEPVESLLFQMDRNTVGCAVLTQILGQFDNRYQQACIKRFPGRFASIVAVDPADPGALAQVKQLALDGAVGLRLRTDAESGIGGDAIWRAAVENALVVSVVGTAAAMLSLEFVARIRRLPALTFVLEHLGGWARPDCDRQASTRDGILSLASLPNVLLKVPGLGQLAPRAARLAQGGPTLDASAAEIVQEAVTHFGADRLMWGSDYPPVSAREGYANALRWTRAGLAGLTQSQLDAVFGGTATRVFRLGQA
jgi:L-fuconolactonase